MPSQNPNRLPQGPSNNVRFGGPIRGDEPPAGDEDAQYRAFVSEAGWADELLDNAAPSPATDTTGRSAVRVMYKRALARDDRRTADTIARTAAALVPGFDLGKELASGELDSNLSGGFEDGHYLDFARAAGREDLING